MYLYPVPLKVASCMYIVHTPYTDMVQYHNQEIDIDSIHWPYWDFSVNHFRVCVCISFYAILSLVKILVTTTTSKYRAVLYHKALWSYPVTATSTSLMPTPASRVLKCYPFKHYISGTISKWTLGIGFFQSPQFPGDSSILLCISTVSSPLLKNRSPWYG